jgi:L-fuconolactonase
MIIDSHHHVWDPERHRIAWLDEPGLAVLRRPYTLDDYLRAASERIPGVPPPPNPKLLRTLLVQAVPRQRESLELLQLASDSGGLVLGVIGWVDLTARDVGDRLRRLRASPGGERLVGIRHPVRQEPDPNWLLRPEVVRGLQAVRDAGLVFDLSVSPDQLAAASEVADLVPDLWFVLDHLGKPPIASGLWQPWARQIKQLARRSNTAAKLSGLLTEERWHDWHGEHILPYTTLALEAFGPERLMYGSDWPVCMLVATYPEVFAFAEQAVSQFDPREQVAFFYGTARRIYGLS